MDDGLFADWTRLLQHRAGLFIAPERRSFLVSGVRARMRESRCGNEREYYDRILSCGSEGHEWALLIDRLTVHETCFFRHQSSMRLTAEQLMAEALANRGACRIWSVGCATGEEAYSLAMLLDDAAQAAGDPADCRVVGADISRPSLQHAREGVYLKRRLQDIPTGFRSRYCSDISDSHFRIVDRLRERMSWFQWNLRDSDAAPMSDIDVLYCQNVLIYYDRQQRIEIVDRLTNCLRTGGVLVLGPGELLDWKHPNMEKVRYADTLAYRRTQ